MNEMDIFPKSYQYKANTIKMLLAIGFFGLCSFFLFKEGQATYTPVLIKLWHILEVQLSASQAQIFFYGFSLMSLIIVFLGFYVLWRDFGFHQEIFITKTSISHVKDHHTIKEISIKDISSLDFSETHIGIFAKNCHITILSPQGKMVINDQLLEKKEYLIEIYGMLQDLRAKIEPK